MGYVPYKIWKAILAKKGTMHYYRKITNYFLEKLLFLGLNLLLQIPDQLHQTLFLLFKTFFNGSNLPFDQNRRFKPSI